MKHLLMFVLLALFGCHATPDFMYDCSELTMEHRSRETWKCRQNSGYTLESCVRIYKQMYCKEEPYRIRTKGETI